MTEARITDHSSIDAENLRFRKERFFKRDYEYDVQDHYGMQEISAKSGTRETATSVVYSVTSPRTNPSFTNVQDGCTRSQANTSWPTPTIEPPWHSYGSYSTTTLSNLRRYRLNERAKPL